jgi:5-methylcytosine-specific restriction endonuclease McrA
MIRASIKRLVRSIYVMRCGYCLVSEAEAGAELTYDHFQPQSQGGSDEASNLVYACHACNEFKGEYFGDTEETRLLTRCTIN